MPTIETLIENLTTFETLLKAQMPVISREMAQTTLSYTLDSIRKNGLPGRPTYSNNPGVPAYLFRGKELNAAGRSFIERKIAEGKKFRGTGAAKFSKFSKIGFVNWKQFRAAQGLQVNEVDVTYSGRMLQNVGTTSVTVKGGNYVTLIEGFDTETKNKLTWNFQRYGKFLAPPKKALDLGRAQGVKRIGNLFATVVKTI